MAIDQTGNVERDGVKYNVYTFTRIDPLAPGAMTYWNVWGTIHMDTTVTSAQSEALFGKTGPYPNGVFPVLVEADAIQAKALRTLPQPSTHSTNRRNCFLGTRLF